MPGWKPKVHVPRGALAGKGAGPSSNDGSIGGRHLAAKEGAAQEGRPSGRRERWSNWADEEDDDEDEEEEAWDEAEAWEDDGGWAWSGWQESSAWAERSSWDDRSWDKAQLQSRGSSSSAAYGSSSYPTRGQYRNGSSYSSGRRALALPQELRVDYSARSIALETTGRPLTKPQLREILTPELRKQMADALQELNADAKWYHIVVDFSNCDLDVKALAILLDFLTECRKNSIYVRILKLFKNRLGDESMNHLAQFLLHQPKPLHEVHLSHNGITELGAATLVLSMSDLHPEKLYPFRPPRAASERFIACWCRMEKNHIARPEELIEALHGTGYVRVVTTTRDSRDYGPLRAPSSCTVAELAPQVILHLFTAQDDPSSSLTGTQVSLDKTLRKAMASVKRLRSEEASRAKTSSSSTTTTKQTAARKGGRRDDAAGSHNDAGAHILAMVKPGADPTSSTSSQQAQAYQSSTAPSAAGGIMVHEGPPEPLSYPSVTLHGRPDEYKQAFSWYRVANMNGMQLHTEPSICAPRTGETLPPNEVFAVCEEYHSQDNRIYLRLADGRGWGIDDTALSPTPMVKKGYWMCATDGPPPPIGTSNGGVASETMQAQWQAYSYANGYCVSTYQSTSGEEMKEGGDDANGNATQSAQSYTLQDATGGYYH